MIKRITSVLLALLVSFALVTAAFAADAPDAAEPVPTKIYFDTTDTGWKEIGYIGFHIWGVDGEAFFDWGGKKQRGTDEGDGVWSYDLEGHGINLDPEKQYAVIFYSDKGAQTYNLLFDTTCLGDIAYPDPSQITENPEDSNKTTMPAYWRHQDPAVNGPELKISSIGNVIGSCIPRSTTREEMLTDYLQNTFENACLYSGLSDQQILDNIGEGLGFTADEMETIIAESGVSVDWDKKLSALPTEDPAVVPTGVRGDADGDGKVTVLDATRIQRYIANMIGENEISIQDADADGDGKVTVLDATRIQRVLAKLCDMDGVPVLPDGEGYELPIIK